MAAARAAGVVVRSARKLAVAAATAVGVAIRGTKKVVQAAIPRRGAVSLNESGAIPTRQNASGVFGPRAEVDAARARQAVVERGDRIRDRALAFQRQDDDLRLAAATRTAIENGNDLLEARQHWLTSGTGVIPAPKVADPAALPPPRAAVDPVTPWLGTAVVSTGLGRADAMVRPAQGPAPTGPADLGARPSVRVRRKL